MIDQRLGRHSTLALTILIPGLLIVGMLLVGTVRPGSSYSRPFVAACLSAPSLCAFGLGIANRDGLQRALARALLAAVLIPVWYVGLVIPAAIGCTVASGASCM
jgi:hypothetical protein